MTQPMDRPGRPPVFHEKRAYRIRRLMDAARIAPVIALVLWLVPLVWPQTGDGRISTATALVYVFVVWGGVIVLTFLMSLILGRIEDGESDQDR